VLGDGAALEQLERGPPVTVLLSHELGFRRALSVRDPDGHTLEIVER
jgi:catechol 2,3-dioxygenase-like lactoylglutathione lyase family enzyme